MIFQFGDIEFTIDSVKAELDPENQFENELEELHGQKLSVELYDGRAYHKGVKAHLDKRLKSLSKSKRPVFVSVTLEVNGLPVRADSFVDINQVPLRDAVYKCASHIVNLLPKKHVDLSI